RPMRRGGGPQRGAERGPDRRRGPRLLCRGALGADLTPVGLRQCADHTAYGRRDPALRGQCARHPDRESRPPLGWQTPPEESDRLDESLGAFMSEERRKLAAWIE